MSLLDRLTGIEEPKLPVHQFWAALTEYAAGKITEANILDAFDILSGTDLSEWQWLVGKYVASTNKSSFIEKIHVIFILAEYKIFGYDQKTVIQNRINELP
jgi:hypothetical protein